MTDILTHLRNAARACTETYEVALSINEVRQIVKMVDGQAAEIERHLADKRVGYEATKDVLSRCQHTPDEWQAMHPELRDFKLKIFAMLDLPCCQLGNGIRELSTPAEVDRFTQAMSEAPKQIGDGT